MQAGLRQPMLWVSCRVKRATSSSGLKDSGPRGRHGRFVCIELEERRRVVADSIRRDLESQPTSFFGLVGT